MADSVIFADGDSITLGLGEPTPYTSLISPAAPPWNIVNGGISGETLAEMYANAPTHVDSNYVAGIRNIVVIWGGTNDFVLNGSTPLEVFDILLEYCAARRAVGWKVIVATMISRTGTNPVSGETIDADKNAYNALILANVSSFADGVASFAGSPLGIDGGYNNLTWFQSDKVHPTEAGITDYEAPIIGTAINAELNSGGQASQQPPPAFVQGNSAATTNASQAIPFLSANSAGCLLVAMVRTTGSSISISDTNNGAWGNLPPVNEDGTTNNQFWYLIGGKQGANTVLFSCLGANLIDGIIAEYSGVLSLDTFAQQKTGSTASPIQSIVTALVGELLIGFTSNNTAPALVTAGVNMTALRENIAQVIAIGDTVAARAGSNILGFTISSAITQVLGVAAFKPQLPYTAVNIFGFAPSSYYGPQNAGLGIYISPGELNGVVTSGGPFSVPASSTTYFWLTSSGLIQSGPLLPTRVYPIAQVVSGNVNTGTRTSLNNPALQVTSPGILSITDLRPTGPFSFN